MPALALLILAVAGAAAAAAVGEFVVSPLCPRPQLAIAKYGRVPRPCNRSPPCCSPWTYSLVSRLPGAVVGSLEVLDTRPGHSAPATCSLDTENVAARSDIRPAASASE